MIQNLGALVPEKIAGPLALDARDGRERRKHLSVDGETVQRATRALPDLDRGNAEQDSIAHCETPVVDVAFLDWTGFAVANDMGSARTPITLLLLSINRRIR